MAKTTLWLRIVGVPYLVLALASVWVIFVNPNLFGPFMIVHLNIAGTGLYFLRQES